MRLPVFFLLLGIAAVIAAPSDEKRSARREMYKSATVELFGHKITLPQWINKLRASMSNFFNKVQKFFSGDIPLSTEVFGKKISFRTNIPDTREDISKSITQFFSNVKTDSATRIVFIIYLNVVVMFVTYTLFFVKQVQLHRRQKSDEKQARKQKKLDEEERRWMIPGDLVPDDMPIMTTMASRASIPRDPSLLEEDRGAEAIDATMFEQGVRDLSDDVSLHLSNTLQDRELGPEMFSPVSSNSVPNPEFVFEAEVHPPPKEEKED